MNGMEVVKSVADIHAKQDSAIALGNFDGLHIGHMEVIRAVTGHKGLRPAIFTFQDNTHRNPMLCTFEDKETLLIQAGVELLYTVPFAEVRSVTAETFFKKILIEKCRAKLLSCGRDFHFGKGALGDVPMLRRLCEEAGVALRVLPYVEMGGLRVSSTRIRKALEDGDVEKANGMLGRPFGFELEVIHGNHIGRGLGTPTINQALPEGFILPKFGVYASVAEVDGTAYCGVTNIGVKPTVGSDQVLSETFMPGFSGDLYGRRVRLHIYGFIRPERKFDSLQEMKSMILKNSIEAKEIVKRYRPNCV